MFHVEHVPDPGVVAAHGISLGAILGTFMGFLPVFAALIPAGYYALLIYESKTVQAWMRKGRAKRAARKIAKLEAQAKIIHAEVDRPKKND